MKKIFVFLLFTSLSLNAMDNSQSQQPQQALLTLDERLPKDVWECIANFLPVSHMFIKELIKHFNFNNQAIYNKIAKEYADSLDFYPKSEEVNSLVAHHFKTSKNASRLSENMKQALSRYVLKHNYGHLKELVISGVLHSDQQAFANLMVNILNECISATLDYDLRDTSPANIQRLSNLKRSELILLDKSLHTTLKLVGHCLELCKVLQQSIRSIESLSISAQANQQTVYKTYFCVMGINISLCLTLLIGTLIFPQMAQWEIKKYVGPCIVTSFVIGILVLLPISYNIRKIDCSLSQEEQKSSPTARSNYKQLLAILNNLLTMQTAIKTELSLR